MKDLYGIAQAYGVQYEGTLVGSEYHAGVDHSETLTLREVQDLRGKITRVRILQEAGRCDISYIHATLPNGKIHPVRVGIDYGIKRYALKSAMVKWAQHEGVYAKGIDLLDEGVWSVLKA